MGLSESVGRRHTEFGGGTGHPQRFPDGQPKDLEVGERKRALTAAGWDEVRGDVGAGVGLPDRVALGVSPTRLNETQTANGYADDARLPGYSQALAP